jgi:hypothetical protein
MAPTLIHTLRSLLEYVLIPLRLFSSLVSSPYVLTNLLLLASELSQEHSLVTGSVY